MDGIRGVVVAAAHAITPLLGNERVAERWPEPSALAGMTIGGLAGHLSRAVETIESSLAEPEPAADDLHTASTYFVAALSMAGDLQGPLHTGIRERAEAAGAVGPQALLTEHRARLDRVADLLETAPATRRVTVLRGAARMTLDEYLPTRLVEIVVHADDLAVSVGATTPAFDPAAMRVVIDVLVGTASAGHGDLAVIRAMARRERGELEALRVF